MTQRHQSLPTISEGDEVIIDNPEEKELELLRKEEVKEEED